MKGNPNPNKWRSGPKGKGKATPNINTNTTTNTGTKLVAKPLVADMSIDRFRTRSMDHSLHDVLPSLISNAIKSLDPELCPTRADPSMPFARYRNIIKDPATVRLLVTSTCQAGCHPKNRVDPNAVFIAADKRHTISLSFAAQGLARVLDEHDSVKSTAALKDRYINVTLANLEMAVNLDNFPREVRLHLVVIQFTIDSYERPDEPINNTADIERHHGVLAQLNLRRSLFMRLRPNPTAFVSTRPPADRLLDLLDLCAPPSSSSETGDLGSPRCYFLTDTQEQALANVPWPPANASQLGTHSSQGRAEVSSQRSLPPSPPPEVLDHPPPPLHVDDADDTVDADTAGDLSKISLPPPSGVTASQLPSSPDDDDTAASRHAAGQRLLPTFSDCDSPRILSQSVLTRFLASNTAHQLPPPTIGHSSEEQTISSSESRLSPRFISHDTLVQDSYLAADDVLEPEPTFLSRLPHSTLFRSTASSSSAPTASPAASTSGPDDQFTPPSPGSSSDIEHEAAVRASNHGFFMPPLSTQQLMLQHGIGDVASATQAFATQVMAYEDDVGAGGEGQVSFDGMLEEKSRWPVERVQGQRQVIDGGDVSGDDGNDDDKESEFVDAVPSGSSDDIAPDSLMYLTPDQVEDMDADAYVEAEDELTQEQLSFEVTVDNLFDVRTATQLSASTISTRPAPPTPAAREVIEVSDSPEPSPVLRTSLSSPLQSQSQSDPSFAASAAADETISTVMSATQSQFSPHLHAARAARVPLAPNEAISIHFPPPAREPPIVVSDESTISTGSQTQTDTSLLSLLAASGSGSAHTGPDLSMFTVSPTQSFTKPSQDGPSKGNAGIELAAVTEEEQVAPPPSFAEEPSMLMMSAFSPIASVASTGPRTSPAARAAPYAYPPLPPLPTRFLPYSSAGAADKSPPASSAGKPKLTRRPPRPSTARPSKIAVTPVSSAASSSSFAKPVTRPATALASPKTKRTRPSIQSAPTTEGSGSSDLITTSPNRRGSTSHVVKVFASDRFARPEVDLSARLLRVAPGLPSLTVPDTARGPPEAVNDPVASGIAVQETETGQTVSNVRPPAHGRDQAAVQADAILKGSRAPSTSLGSEKARSHVAAAVEGKRAASTAPASRARASSAVAAQSHYLVVDVPKEVSTTNTIGAAHVQPEPTARARALNDPAFFTEKPPSVAQGSQFRPPRHQAPAFSPSSQRRRPPSPAPLVPPAERAPTQPSFTSHSPPPPPPQVPPASNISTRSHSPSSTLGPQLIIRGVKRKHDSSKPKPPINVDPFEAERAAMAAMLAAPRPSRASATGRESKAAGKKSRKSQPGGEADDEGQPPIKKQRKM